MRNLWTDGKFQGEGYCLAPLADTSQVTMAMCLPFANMRLLLASCNLQDGVLPRGGGGGGAGVLPERHSSWSNFFSSSIALLRYTRPVRPHGATGVPAVLGGAAGTRTKLAS